MHRGVGTQAQIDIVKLGNNTSLACTLNIFVIAFINEKLVGFSFPHDSIALTSMVYLKVLNLVVYKKLL